MATSGCATQSAYVKKDVGPSDISPYISRIWDCSHPIRPSYSALSFSLSMHSAERSGTDYIDTGLQKPSCNLLDQESAQPEAKEVVRTCYKDKKKVRRYVSTLCSVMVSDILVNFCDCAADLPFINIFLLKIVYKIIYNPLCSF